MNTPNLSGRQWNERCNASGSPLDNTTPMFRLLFERSADAMPLFTPATGRFLELNDAFAWQVRAPGEEPLTDDDSAIVRERLYLRQTQATDPENKGLQPGVAQRPANFAAAASRRPIVAENVTKPIL